MKRKRLKQIFLIYIICSVLFISSSFFINENEALDPFFTLIAKSLDKEYYDYLFLIKDQLKRCGIGLVIDTNSHQNVADWLILNEEPDYNIFIGSMDFSTKYFPSTTFLNLFSENFSTRNRNLFGYDEQLDFNETLEMGENEWYIQQIASMNPFYSQERRNLLWDWQEYFMEKLFCFRPLLIPIEYTVNWDGLEGFNTSQNLLQNWGKMNWAEPHLGQNNTSELVIAKNEWIKSHPGNSLIEDDTNNFIYSLICDQLFWFDDANNIKPHLARSYEYINDSCIRVYLREGIKWQVDPENKFVDEYFDAEDVYFSFSVSNQDFYCHSIDWLEKVDIIDNYTVDFHIKNYINSIKNEIYPDAINKIALRILPEHYLNQTQEEDGLTPDISDPSWELYKTKPFGTSLFKLESTNEAETILSVFEDSWFLNNSITNAAELNWVNRFGDFTDILEKLRIKHMQGEAESFIRFKKGEIDLFTSLTVPESIFSNENDYKVSTKLSDKLIFIGFNIAEESYEIGNRDPCPKDPAISRGYAIRRAISYSINALEINKIYHSGKQLIADSLIHWKYSAWISPDFPYSYNNYDLDKGTEFLDIAGFDFYAYTYDHNENIGIVVFFYIMVIISIILIPIVIVVVIVWAIISSFKKSPQFNNMKEKKEYTCFSCNAKVKNYTKICSSCSSPILYCMVCSLPISKGEILGKCTNCNSSAHFEHLHEWVKMKGECPHCSIKMRPQDIVIDGLDDEAK